MASSFAFRRWRRSSPIFVADLLGLDKVPPGVSLAITLGILTAGILASLWKTRGDGRTAAEPAE